ncbi:Cna B-type domain-containing protein, partial [Methanobrevibacter sp.]|uniref:Cna B-type domain-containing protein n=1 Tax=Methanobrevibacter sp. TaxID=66852 RepID=UPI0025E50B85
MRFKRYLFLTLILFLTIFSISFVSASENATYNQNTGELTTLSMSDIDSIDENLKTVNLDSVEETDDSSLGKVNEDEIDEIESDDCLDNNETQQLRSIDESTSVEVLSAGNDLEVDNESLIILGATIDEPVLGNNQYLNDGDATTERVMNAILECSRTGGGTVYLYGRTYSGTATADAPANTIVNITNVKVVGGSPNDPNQIATFDVNPTQMALSFRGDQNPRYYSGSGFNFTNVTFENLKSNGRMFSFCSGSLTDVVFNNLESYQHLFFLYGCYVDSQPINLTNCNFTNCRQTYAGANGISDGSGQLGAIFGAKLVGCNFINTSSANHGGAFCLSDEYTGGAERVASSLIDCNFINVTSRWFAVYIHGNYSGDSQHSGDSYISNPQVLDNCKFINCSSSAEYGGALGISHNNVIIRNSEFINNTGGEGAAIMVGGIEYGHDAFWGKNTEGNNMTIENCTFKNNVARIQGQSSTYVPNLTTTLTPSGNAGAVFVYGNNTKIINTVFENNTAANDGAAIYIHGWGTVIENSTLTGNSAVEGTIYIEGSNTKITNSTYVNNNAVSGAGVYIIGSNATITDSTFENNTATESGAAAYINGQNTVINNSEVNNNHAGVYGGGFYVIGSDCNVMNLTSNNNTAMIGGAIAVAGDGAVFTDIVSLNNSATLMGGSTYVMGENTLFENGNFSYNTAPLGGAITVVGSDTTFLNNNVTYNKAEPSEDWDLYCDGGAICIEGERTNFTNNNISHNSARDHGGGVYVSGSDTYFENIIADDNNALNGGFAQLEGATNLIVKNSSFTNNHALGDLDNLQGEGGAFHIEGSENADIQGYFFNNTAINGSAIYVVDSSLYIHDSDFIENQAITHELAIYPENDTDFKEEDEMIITITHIGGDNIANAIHDYQRSSTIIVNNITYPFYHDGNETIMRTPAENVTPVYGWENSQNGTVIYEDEQENNQVIYYFVRNRLTGEYIIENASQRTDIDGTIFLNLTGMLPVGFYEVVGTYIETPYYTAAYNFTALFGVEGLNLTINKTVDQSPVYVNDTVVFTINVTNHGPYNATNVTVNDIVPSQFNVTGCNDTAYNMTTGVLIIPQLNVNASYAFTITAVALVVGTWTNNATANCKENETIVWDDATVVVLPLTDINVTKIWNDADNQDGLRPKNITVILLAGEVEINSTVLSDDNNWTYIFTDLPVTTKNGTVIVYDIKEIKVNNYTVTVTRNNYTFIINNTHNPLLTNINVTKVWDDEDNKDGYRPTNITIVLLSDGIEINRTVLSNSTGWNYTFVDLPVFNNGTPINYTIDEFTVENYTVVINKIANYTFVINNTHVPDVTNITVVKVWTDNNNQDGIRPVNITVQLLADGKVINTTVLSNETGWNYTWQNLSVYNNGVLIIYTVNETAVANYTVNITSPGNYRFVINNTHVPDVTNVTVVKVWTDNSNQDGVRPVNITVQLLADGVVINTTVLSNVTGWNYTWYDLPVYNSTKLIKYTINETIDANYAVKITSQGNYRFVINNTHNPRLTNINVTKVWDDNSNQDGVRPVNITVQLLADGVVINTTVLSNVTGWNYTWYDLPVYNSTKLINYTVNETIVANYTVKITSPGNYSFIINNTHIPVVTNVTVVKIWNDGNNASGTRPANITVELFADGIKINEAILNASNNWMAIFAGLPVYNDSNLINYTIREFKLANHKVKIIKVDNYTFMIENTLLTVVNVTKIWNDGNNATGTRPANITVEFFADGVKINETVLNATNDWKYSFTDLLVYNGTKLINYTINEITVANYIVNITKYANGTIVIKNTLLTDINVTKVWDDNDNQDGKRPQNLTIYLFADGNLINTTVLSNVTGWNYTWYDLPVYKENGTEIIYSVYENVVANYTFRTIGNNYYFIIINTHNPLNTTVNVTKVWNDADNHDKVRPPSIIVVLLADGDYYANCTLSDDNNWTYVFEDLPAYNNTKLINYTVQEFNVTNYTVKIINLGNGTFIINNTHEIIVGLSINKTVDEPVVYVNETVVFTINVTNNGPSIATNVTVKDIVPPQFNVTDCNDTKYRNNQLVVGTLNPGQSYVFTITAVALVNGTWTNVAN